MVNVKHILEEMQQRWGDQYVVDTVDGLELEDCEGTQGKEIQISSSSYHMLFHLEQP